MFTNFSINRLQSKIPVMKSCVKELNLDKEQVKTAFEELEKGMEIR